jgi:hypothetical protein
VGEVVGAPAQVAREAAGRHITRAWGRGG